MTADENDLYQDLAGEGERPPTPISEEAIDAAVLKQGPGGFDPIPSIRKLKIPALWLYGGKDTFIPPRLSARRLAPIAAESGRDFTVADFPKANHALVETTTGPHVRDAPLRHLRARPLRQRRRLARRPWARSAAA